LNALNITVVSVIHVCGNLFDLMIVIVFAIWRPPIAISRKLIVKASFWLQNFKIKGCFKANSHVRALAVAANLTRHSIMR
jgi:hypothetical protein